MKSLERKTMGELKTESLRGVSFFNGYIDNNLLATITGIFEDKRTKKVIIGVNYPSTGSFAYHPLDCCKNYVLANPKEVENATKKCAEYSE
jgi:hypothetical protein